MPKPPALKAPRTASLPRPTPKALQAWTAGTSGDDTPWFRIHMPYVFMCLHPNKRLWIPLNRDYRPVGVEKTDDTWVEFEIDYSDRIVHTSVDLATLAGTIFLSGTYLYDDSVESRVDYFERVNSLMRFPMTLATPRQQEMVRKHYLATRAASTAKPYTTPETRSEQP
jgi:hypothetical protein